MKQPLHVVYTLEHTYQTDSGRDETKSIGVYSSRATARAAIKRLRGMPGFRDHPGGFEICRIPVNQDGWSTGFISSEAPSASSRFTAESNKVSGARRFVELAIDVFLQSNYIIADLDIQKSSKPAHWLISIGLFSKDTTRSFEKVIGFLGTGWRLTEKRVAHWEKGKGRSTLDPSITSATLRANDSSHR